MFKFYSMVLIMAFGMYYMVYFIGCFTEHPVYKYTYVFDLLTQFHDTPRNTVQYN